MISRQLLIVKTFFVFIMFIATAWYLINHANLHIINVSLLHSLVLFLNDLNTDCNIIEYIAILLIKLIFNIDIHQLQSFFDNINPVY